MSYNIRHAALFIFVALTSQWSAADSSGASSQSIKIGIITDLSAGAAYLGNQTRRGAELAADESVAEGRNVTLIFGDHQSNNKLAAAEAQKLASVDRVDAVFSNFSGPARAINPIMQERGVLYVYTAAAMSPLQENRYAFKSYMDNRAGCRAVAALWSRKGIARISVLKPDVEFGELCAEGAKEAVNDAHVEAYNLNEQVKAQVLRLRSPAGLVGILNPSFEPDIRSMLQSIRQEGVRASVGITEDSFTPALIEAFRGELEGAITFGMPRPSEAFLKRLRERNATLPASGIEFAGMSYLHIKQLVRALSRCGSNNLNCAAEALQASEPDRDFGFLGWSEQRTAQYQWMLRECRNGKLADVDVLH